MSYQNGSTKHDLDSGDFNHYNRQIEMSGYGLHDVRTGGYEVRDHRQGITWFCPDAAAVHVVVRPIVEALKARRAA